MDCCLSYAKPRIPTLPAANLRRPNTSIVRRPLIVVVAAASKSGISKCEFGGLTAPLEPRTPAGRFLSGVLLDDRDKFEIAARKELGRLAAERDEVAARLRLSIGSDEACLHRRIAELKKHESQDEVEEVMYMLVLSKFSEMRVHLVPRLYKCVYNGRFEIWPSKDWELESIHSFEVLQMVRDHLTAVVGCGANSNVTDGWATTQIPRLRLCRLYAASILYGYFLKSASLRHHLEQGLYSSTSNVGLLAQSKFPVSEMFSLGSEYIACGRVDRPRPASVGGASRSLGMRAQGNLSFYVKGFDAEMIRMCARPKSTEAVNLIERHSLALFGDEETGLLATNDVITTSFASLRRFMLEAVDFGSFLWDAENFVNTEYMLEEN